MKSYGIDGNWPDCPKTLAKRACPGPDKCDNEECELVKEFKENKE